MENHVLKEDDFHIEWELTLGLHYIMNSSPLQSFEPAMVERN